MPPRTLRPLACPCHCGLLGPWMERRLHDPQSTPRGQAVGGGRRLARQPALVPQVAYRVGKYPVPRCFHVAPCPAGDWLACWRVAARLAPHPARYLCTGRCPHVWVRRWHRCSLPLRASVRIPCRPSTRFHRGLLALWQGWRCGWRGCVVFCWRPRMGLAIWYGCRPGPFSHVACQCSRSTTPLRRGAPGCRCPALQMWEHRREPVAWHVCLRGVGWDAGARWVRFRVWPWGRGTARWRFCRPYCWSGWTVLALMGRRFGLRRGWWMVPRGRRAGCRWSLGTGAPRGVVGVGAPGAEGSLGLGAGGVGRGSSECLCWGRSWSWTGRAVGRCVCEACHRSYWWVVVQVGPRAGLCGSRWQPAACGRVRWCLGL